MSEFLDREAFIKQHGFDPDQGVITAVPQDTTQRRSPTLADIGRGLVTGVATAIPDVIGLPQTVSAAVGAGYDALTSDAKFGEGYAKRVRVAGAEEKTAQHMRDKIAEWRTQDATITEQDIPALVKQYAETPAYEKYQQSLLSGPLGVASRFKDGVRDFVGEERTDKQRSWVDSAAEIVGSSVVGLGAGTAASIAGKIGKNAAIAAVLNNPVGYGALRVAEAVTPLTLPLTPGNVALNAGVGVTLDQGLRYAMGDTTVLSSNDTNLGGVAAIAGATGAAAAAVAVMRGRTAPLNSITPALSPNIQPMVEGLQPGGAVVRAGPAFSEYDTSAAKPSMQFSGSIVKDARGATRIAQGNVLDEYAPVYKMIQDEQGKEVADYSRVIFSNQTGAGGRDTAAADANRILRPLNDVLAALPPDELQKHNLRWNAHNAEMRTLDMQNTAQAKIDEFTILLQKRSLTVEEATEQAGLITKRDSLINDAPEARQYMPDITRAEVQALNREYLNDPAYAKIRAATQKVGDQAVDLMIKSGMIDSTQGTTMRAKYPYFLHMQQDPLDGAQGIQAAAKAFMLQVRDDKKLREANAGNRNIVDTLNKDILDDANIRRITMPMDPQLAMQTYMRNLHYDAQQNVARREITRALTVDAQGMPTKYINDGNIIQKTVNNRSEFSQAELRSNTAVRALADNPQLLRVYTNGKVRFYDIGDPSVAAVLRMEPKLFTGWSWAFKAAADTFKTNTTGLLSPMFAPVNALYDTTMGGLIKTPNRAFGPLDTIMRRVVGEQLGKHIGGRIFDPTVYAALPWHVVAGMGEVIALRSTRYIARDLAQDGLIASIGSTMGKPAYERLVQSMLLAVERSKTAIMLDKGITHSGAMNQVNEAMSAFSYVGKAIPGSVRNLYDFYRDLITAVHASPKRQFYAQNHLLLEQKYGKDRVPAKEMSRLLADTRNLSGDMTRQAGSDAMRTLEAAAPYLAPMRNGTVHLARSLSDPRYVTYTYPRLAQMMVGVMASFYMMSNWNDEARKEFWINTPEWMRYRYLHIPTPELIGMWHRGEKPAFDAKLIYKIPIGPDLAPIIAGTSAFLRGIGALPNSPDEIPKTGAQDFSKMVTDMIAPVFPPLISAPLAAAGVKIDLAESGGRGIISTSQGNPFQRGLQTETASPLGEMESTMSRLLGTLFGSNGTYIARSYDAMMHATKFDQQAAQSGKPAPARDSMDYMAGLKAATTTFLGQVERRAPDFPGIWKGAEKQYVATPAADVVRETKTHIASIVGMRDYAVGKRSNEKRNVSNDDGLGIVQGYVRDPALLRIADEIRTFDRAGDFKNLKAEYSNLAATRRAVESNYAAPKDARTARINQLIDQMQNNVDQQRIATMYLEQTLQEKYGDVVNRHLDGQPLTLKSFDQLMRKAAQSGSQPQ